MSLNRRNWPGGFGCSSGWRWPLVLGLRCPLGHGLRPQVEESIADRHAGAKRDDPKARALLDEVVKAYKALSAYSDQGEFVVAMTISGKSDKQVSRSS